VDLGNLPSETNRGRKTLFEDEDDDEDENDWDQQTEPRAPPRLPLIAYGSRYRCWFGGFQGYLEM
jgi:hypothetical protein